jgi:hypothetical protein
LIDFEFGNNNFKLEDVRKIQEHLIRNRNAFDKARLEEWRERKQMRGELESLEKLYLKKQTAEQEKQMEEDNRMLKEREIEENWKKYVAEQRIEKEQVITMLEDAAGMRGKKGKGKRGGKGGKGKKKK